jgi:hypothetical protein
VAILYSTRLGVTSVEEEFLTKSAVVYISERKVSVECGNIALPSSSN